MAVSQRSLNRFSRVSRRCLGVAAGLSLGAVVALCAVPVEAQPSTAPPRPWGPLHLLARQPVSADLDAASTALGMNVVAWRARQPDGTFQAIASVQAPGRAWSRPTRLSGPHRNATSVVAVAWGERRVSVLWQTHSGRDAWTVKMRTVHANTRWGPIATLRTATHAYPGFQVDVNDAGAIALGWENGDHRDRVAIRRADGRWHLAGPPPVVSPGAGSRFVANPQDLFIANSGHVSVVTWGRRLGTPDNALWLEDLTRTGIWRSTRIGPTRGDRLAYDWVPEAQFAGNAAGDVAAVWPQRDPLSHRWTTLFAYRQAGHTLGRPQVLGHDRCDYLYRSCADTALGDSGHAVVAWPRPAHDVAIEVARSSVSGQLYPAQKVLGVVWGNAFSGVTVGANADGDATVNFTGGTRQLIYQEFVRCAARHACAPAVARESRPSWLDVVHLALNPNGGTTTTWVSGCSGGEACRPNHVWARRLEGLG